ncbi:hypothetical protein OIV83_001997 [Microbotryomycetes sp. JL201]|nr:hypothetical protein OIV83_001997 [Microbotryomycetes sp. JL201]
MFFKGKTSAVPLRLRRYWDLSKVMTYKELESDIGDLIAVMQQLHSGEYDRNRISAERYAIISQLSASALTYFGNVIDLYYQLFQGLKINLLPITAVKKAVFALALSPSPLHHQLFVKSSGLGKLESQNSIDGGRRKLLSKNFFDKLNELTALQSVLHGEQSGDYLQWRVWQEGFAKVINLHISRRMTRLDPEAAIIFSPFQFHSSVSQVAAAPPLAIDFSPGAIMHAQAVLAQTFMTPKSAQARTRTSDPRHYLRSRRQSSSGQNQTQNAHMQTCVVTKQQNQSSLPSNTVLHRFSALRPPPSSPPPPPALRAIPALLQPQPGLDALSALRAPPSLQPRVRLQSNLQAEPPSQASVLPLPPGQGQARNSAVSPEQQLLQNSHQEQRTSYRGSGDFQPVGQAAERSFPHPTMRSNIWCRYAAPLLLKQQQVIELHLATLQEGSLAYKTCQGVLRQVRWQQEQVQLEAFRQRQMASIDTSQSQQAQQQVQRFTENVSDVAVPSNSLAPQLAPRQQLRNEQPPSLVPSPSTAPQGQALTVTNRFSLTRPWPPKPPSVRTLAVREFGPIPLIVRAPPLPPVMPSQVQNQHVRSVPDAETHDNVVKSSVIGKRRCSDTMFEVLIESRKRPKTSKIRRRGSEDVEHGANQVRAPTAASPKAAASACPAGTKLTGLNYLKDGADPVAKEDAEYPAWLWSLVEPAKKGTDGTTTAANPRGTGKKFDLKAEQKKLKRDSKAAIKASNTLKG